MYAGIRNADRGEPSEKSGLCPVGKDLDPGHRDGDGISDDTKKESSLRVTLRELDAVAEKGGFEPPRPFMWTCTLSRGVHSTSLPLLRSINCGAAGRIRTHDPLVRSQILYPTELQPRKREVNFILEYGGLSRGIEQKV